MAGLLQDLSYALRVLRKSPGFAAIALATLAIGIGANTAIFTVVDAVLLKPLPYPESNRLAMVWEDASKVGFGKNTPAPANYLDWKRQNQVFESMAAMRHGGFSLTGGGEPELIFAPKVEWTFFNVLGANAALGRTFTEDDDRPEAQKVVVLSHTLWTRRFGSNPAIVGREILLNDEKWTVVGVMPPGWVFPDARAQLWAPLRFDAANWAKRKSHFLNVVGRLKPSISLERAQSDMSAIAKRLEHDYPDSNKELGAVVVSLQDQYTGDVSTGLRVLLAAVGLVLLIACANVANLLLAKASSRSREMAVRAAIGAGRGRILRQLLAESGVLALGGAALGALLATSIMTILGRLLPPHLAGVTEIHIDARVLAFTGLIAALSAIIFGLAPAWKASRVDLNDALKQGGRGNTGAHSGLRDLLVAGEVALAATLLVGAGLLIQTLYRLNSVDLGFRTERAITFLTPLSPKKYDTDPKRLAYMNAVLERVRALPGVQLAGYASELPLVMKGNTRSFTREGYPPPAVGDYLDANYREVSPGYLETMGIAILRGRSISDTDGPQQPKAAVINATAAKTFWPGRDPLGRRFKFGGYDSKQPWFQIVGIAGDVHQMGIDTPPRAEIYVPDAQVEAPDTNYLVVRSAADPSLLVPAVVKSIRAVDPELPVTNIKTLDDIKDDELVQRKMQMWVLASFSLVALGLAGIGIYGVLSFAVEQRTAEIGLRMALGAQTQDVIRMVAGRGLRMALLGLVVGLIAASGLTRLISTILFGVQPNDPWTFAVIAATVFIAAAAASVLPALRAARLDPVEALRNE